MQPMEDLQNQAKNIFAFVQPQNTQGKEENDFDKMMQKREDHAVEIRKGQRNEILNKRRQLQGALNQNNNNQQNNIQEDQNNQQQNAIENKVQVQDPQLKQQIDEWLKKTFHIQQDFPQLIECINCNDLYRQHYGVIGLRKILSIEDGPPIQAVIDANLVPKLIEYIKQEQHLHLQLEAAWALTNIASGSSHQTQTIIDKGGIPLFVNLLKSQHSEIAEQAIWALGNIAGDCSVYRDMILKSGGLQPLINIIDRAQNKNTIKHGTWAVSNLCRGRPLPSFDLVKNAIPILAKVLISSQESEVLTDAAWALSYLSDGNEDRIDMVIKTGAIPSLVQLLKHPYLSILIPSLRTLGNIVTGNEKQTNQVLEQDRALEMFFDLLNHQKKSVRREACWTISNITAGTANQISLIVQRKEYIDKLIMLMETDVIDIKRESTWVLSNATSQGSPNDTKLLTEYGVLEAFVKQLDSEDVKTVAVVLEAINNILKTGEKHFMVDGQNIFTMRLEALGAIEKIEQLQEHHNDDIYKKSLRILEDHFVLDEAI